MSAQLARRVSIAHAAVRDMPGADAHSGRAADIPDSYARRHAVLGQRYGALCDALASGDDRALEIALLALCAASGAWLAHLEDEKAR